MDNNNNTKIRGLHPGQDTKRVATSLLLDTFGGFIEETDVWLVKKAVIETRVSAAELRLYCCAVL